MKKLTAFFLAAALMLSLTACGGSDEISRQGGGAAGSVVPFEPAQSDPVSQPDSEPAVIPGDAGTGDSDLTPESLGFPGEADVTPVLPDFAAFSNGYAAQDGDLNDTFREDEQERRLILKYSCSHEAGEVLVPDYASLLTDTGAFTLKGSYENPDQDLAYYWFTYTGEGDVPEFSMTMCNIGTNMETVETGEINLCLMDIDYTDIGHNREITLHFTPELEVRDTGDRTTYVPSSVPGAPEPDSEPQAPASDSTSESSASSSNKDSSKSKGSSTESSGSSWSGGTTIERWTPCTKCHGDGTVECSNCDGDGGKYVYSYSTPNYAGDTHFNSRAETWERCFKCHGTGETTCTRCGGSGRLSY